MYKHIVKFFSRPATNALEQDPELDGDSNTVLRFIPFETYNKKSVEIENIEWKHYEITRGAILINKEFIE